MERESNARQRKILCVGSATVDVMAKLREAIPVGGRLSAVERTEVHSGGCAVNAAIDLGKLGIPVALSCLLGKDSFGETVRLETAKAGVDISGVVLSETLSTTVSIVLIDQSGERNFLYDPGSSAAFTAEQIPDDLLSACDIVFVGGALLLKSFDGAPCGAFLKKAKAMGKYTVMDTAWDYEDLWLPKIREALPFVDLFLPSLGEAERLSEKQDPEAIADFFFSLGCGKVVIKLGKEGALLCEERGKAERIPAAAGGDVVDTTGAGDAFCAGVLAGLSCGWDLSSAVRLGHGVSAFCIRELGASSGIRPLSQITRWMAEERERKDEINL